MSFYKYNTLSTLNDSTEEWNIRVRAQSIWKGINRETGELKGYNIIFVDDSSERIHAFISPQIGEKIEKEFVEGFVYTVTNFKIKIYNGDETNRPIRTDKHIYFTNETVLEKDETPGLTIPQFSFDLFMLEDLEAMKKDNRFLTDVVAVILDVQPKTSYIKDGKEKSHVLFSITDGKNVINVTFFNEFGNSFLNAMEKVVDKINIITICCAKVSDWKGSLYLTNFPSTRFYLNADHYSVSILRNRANEPNFYAMDIDEKEEPGVPVMKVFQLQKLTEDYIEKEVCCQLTVKKVDENMSWYIPICTHCDIEIVEVNKKFKCPTPECGRVYPYPDRRFQLYTLCSDESGTIPVVWPDDEICRITGNTVYDVVGDDPEVEKGKQFPKMLKFCEKKTYNFTIVITATNVKEGSKVYKASQISEVEITASHSPSLNQTLQPVATEMSIGSDSHEINVKDTTPPTAKSSNKTKSRMIEEVNSTEEAKKKIQKLKNIKLEKI